MRLGLYSRLAGGGVLGKEGKRTKYIRASGYCLPIRERAAIAYGAGYDNGRNLAWLGIPGLVGNWFIFGLEFWGCILRGVMIPKGWLGGQLACIFLDVMHCCVRPIINAAIIVDTSVRTIVLSLPLPHV